jgi:hypothetical protein
VVEELFDLSRTTHHTKTEHVTKSRGRHSGDIQLEVYLPNVTGPVPLVLDLESTTTVSEVGLTPLTSVCVDEHSVGY